MRLQLVVKETFADKWYTFFTCQIQMPFLWAKRQCQSTKGKLKHWTQTMANHSLASLFLHPSLDSWRKGRCSFYVPTYDFTRQYLNHDVAQQFDHRPAQVCRGQNSEQCRHMGEQFAYRSTPHWTSADCLVTHFLQC